MKKILVIQNNDDELKNLDSILEKEEFEIFHSHNLKDGVEIAVRYLPDLLLFYLSDDASDIDMLEKISSQEKIILVPVFVISKNYSFEQQRKVMDLGADDYFPADRMETSLVNSIHRKFSKLSRLRENVASKLNSFEDENGKNKRDDHILVKLGNKLKLVKFSDIVCITSLKEYSKITTRASCKIVVRKSLKNWIAVLPAKSFLQIHRATIINIDYIDKIVKTNERTYTAHMKIISETFDFSHRYANIMRQTFPS